MSFVGFSPNICSQVPIIPLEWAHKFGDLTQQLEKILNVRNGFFSFESALHLFPSNCLNYPQELLLWNQFDLWKKSYSNLEIEGLFFGEDIFGTQFVIYDNGISKFDPETSDMETMASNFEEWAELILEDYEVETGYPLAHEWQEKNGYLPVGKRLVPKLPFVLGGEFNISNLELIDAIDGMKLRSKLACKLKDIPDGNKIKFNSYKDIIIS
jgi:hypothetical protein